MGTLAVVVVFYERRILIGLNSLEKEIEDVGTAGTNTDILRIEEELSQCPLHMYLGGA